MSNTIPLYIGTTPQNAVNGIYLVQFDTESGTATKAQLVAEQPGASFLAATTDGRFLYAVNDGFLDDNNQKGGLSAYQIDGETGQLTFLNTVAAAGVPCHISLDSTEKWLLDAAYTQGNFGVWPLQNNGAIGPALATIDHEGHSIDPRRQTAPHPHHIVTSPDNKLICVTDLGMDKVMMYDFDAAAGQLSAQASSFAQLAPGAGPRHLAFHPSQDAFYVVNELDNTVTAFTNQGGTFNAIQAISTLPPGYDEPTFTAEILISASGKFVYASNRGHHSVAVYRVNDDRSLTLLDITSTGKFPQYLAFSPDENWLLSVNRDDASLTVFRIDAATGSLAEHAVVDDLPGKPMCVAFADKA